MSQLVIAVKKKMIIVYCNNEILLQQEYIKNKQYTYFYVLHWIHKFSSNININIKNKKKK